MKLNPRAFKFLRLTAQWAETPEGPKKELLLRLANQALAECTEADKKELRDVLRKMRHDLDPNT